MNLEALSLPDLPMPESRVHARQHAMVRYVRARSRHHRHVGWRVAVPVAATGALAAVVAVAELTSNPVALTSSWTAVPTPVSASEAASAGSACQAELDSQHWPLPVTAMSTVLADDVAGSSRS